MGFSFGVDYLHQLGGQIDDLASALILHGPRDKGSLPDDVGTLVRGGFGQDGPIGAAQTANSLGRVQPTWILHRNGRGGGDNIARAQLLGN